MSRKNVSQEVAAVSLADRLREARVAAGYSKMVDAVRAQEIRAACTFFS